MHVTAQWIYTCMARMEERAVRVRVYDDFVEFRAAGKSSRWKCFDAQLQS